MSTTADVAATANSLPDVVEGERHGNATWRVADKAFAWVRPFSKADIRRYGDDPVPAGDIVALSVADLSEKEAVLSAGHPGVFTISHFDGFAAVLVQLAAVSDTTLHDLVIDAWCARAPTPLVERYLGR